jgi:CheY-like chemotaxis protein
MAKMLERLLGEDVALELKCAGEILPIEADAGMIEQIIMNLAVNSRDAMPKGGQLLITTTTLEADEAYVQHHPEARSGPFVCLTVTDTGCGMDAQTQSRIFEPFFTTKEVGKGTGLGLATVYGIAKQHQGWIDLKSVAGVGTTFQIFLPRSPKALDRTGEKPAVPPIVGPGRKETILLVEDEPMLRELARMILKDFDYLVLEAGTGKEALKVWDEHQGEVDLLLTDMVMPDGMNGRELADQLKTHKPNLKIIYTSGYSPEVMGADLGHRNVRFLQKPYPPPQLAQAVRECLDVV